MDMRYDRSSDKRTRNDTSRKKARGKDKEVVRVVEKMKQELGC